GGASGAVARVLIGREDAAALSRIRAQLERCSARSSGAAVAETAESEVGRTGSAALGEGAVAPSGLAASAPATPSGHDDRVEIQARMAAALQQGVAVAAGQLDAAMPRLESPSESRRRRLEGLVAPIRNCLDRRSVVGRHALRYGIVTAVAVAIEYAL